MDTCQECNEEFETEDLFIGSLSGDNSCEYWTKLDILCSKCYKSNVKKDLIFE